MRSSKRSCTTLAQRMQRPVESQPKTFPRRVPRPSFAYGTNCSPDEAKRNPGTALQLECCSPDYAALHPGYDDYRKKRSGTPTDVCSQPPHLAMRRAPLSLSPPPLAGEGWEGARSPIGVPPRLLPSGLSPRRLSSRPGFLGRGRTFDPVRLAPTGEQRPCALPRALPAPACPSPGNAPPGPVIVPVR